MNAPAPRSRLPVVAGIAIVIVVVLVVVGLLAFLASALAPLVARTPLQDLSVGQCFNGGRAPTETGSGLLFGVEVVPCAEPHTSELAATFDYPGASPGVAYPGLESARAYAEEECITEFENYVGLGFAESVLEMTFVYPLEANWALGDYSIQCVLHPPAGQDQSSDSFRNARR